MLGRRSKQAKEAQRDHRTEGKRERLNAIREQTLPRLRAQAELAGSPLWEPVRALIEGELETVISAVVVEDKPHTMAQYVGLMAGYRNVLNVFVADHPEEVARLEAEAAGLVADLEGTE